MKRRYLSPETSSDAALRGLCEALLAMRDAGEMRAFLNDLCTPAELESLADRWSVVPRILEGMSYREIHEHTAVSITTIGRIARFLNNGAGGYRLAAERVLRKRARELR